MLRLAWFVWSVCVIGLLWILTLRVFDAEYRPYQGIGARFHIAPSSTVAAYANADVPVTIR